MVTGFMIRKRRLIRRHSGVHGLRRLNAGFPANQPTGGLDVGSSTSRLKLVKVRGAGTQPNPSG